MVDAVEAPLQDGPDTLYAVGAGQAVHELLGAVGEAVDQRVGGYGDFAHGLTASRLFAFFRLIPSCVQSNVTWYKGSGNRCPQNEDEISNQPKSWGKITLPQRLAGLPWYPMPIGYQDIFENAGFPGFFKNFGVQRSMPIERDLV